MIYEFNNFGFIFTNVLYFEFSMPYDDFLITKRVVCVKQFTLL